jgi:RNA polymerase sigma factor (TIGR02999 family)
VVAFPGSRAGSTQSPSDSPHPAFRAGPPLNCAECAGENAMSQQNSEPASQAVPSYSGAIPVSSPAEARQALDNLFSLTYEELRRLAYSVRRGDPSATLSPTALVNEAWLKLANSPGVASAPRLHFKRIAARAMRQLLVEAARRRHSQKRGGADDISVITFDESIMQTANCGKELLALESALQELARVQPRQAMMVECRFFGGLDIAETAALLEVSEATILRDWRAAKAWLAHTLRNVH